MKKELTFKRKLLYVFLALVMITSICSCSSDNTASDTKENPTNVSQVIPEVETAPVEKIKIIYKDEASKAQPEAVVVPVESTPSYTEDTANTAQVEITVYVTKTGEKYHSAGCQYLRQSKIAISLSDARASYSPCSKCNPPL